MLNSLVQIMLFLKFSDEGHDSVLRLLIGYVSENWIKKVEYWLNLLAALISQM